jgi:phage-related protein
MSTFNPPKNPDIGLSQKNKPRVLRSDFGDGYTQRAGDGLNSVVRTISLSWTDLSDTDADTIDDFFEALTPGEAFDYTLPLATTSQKFTVNEWSRTFGSGVHYNINAEFEKVYDL